MKKIIIRTTLFLAIAGSVGFVLANNKAKINKAANPVKEKLVIPVMAHEVREDSFSASFNINGSTSPIKEVTIASEVEGKLVALFVKNGDAVHAGQTIAILDASVYHAQLNSVEASIAKANLDLSRYNRLITMGGATPMQAEGAQLQINSLQAEKKQILQQIAHMQIRAPFTGRIENVTVELGSYVTHGTVLGQLVDNSSLKIKVYLSEQEAFKVKQGQPVSVSSAVLMQPRTGRVATISEKADATGKFLAEVHLANNDKEKLRAGMLADVAFAMDAKSIGLSVPVSALVAGGKQVKVYVVNNGKVSQRNIKTGIVTPLKIQVVEGLKAGEKVVVSGQMNLEEGTAVSVNQ